MDKASELLVSVVVCTFNREAYLPKCLAHLLNQTADKSTFEVIIIDNNSTDKTHEICQQAILNYPQHTIKYFKETQQGLSFARNRGIKEANGNIIVFLDDDAFCTNNYIKNILQHFTHNPDWLVIGGRILPFFPDGKPSWFNKHFNGIASAMDLGDKMLAMHTKNKYPFGGNAAYRRLFFEKYGYFNTQIGRIGNQLLAGEEKELFLRLNAEDKKKIFYCPDVLVEHVTDKNKLTANYIKRFGQGFGTSERIFSKNYPFKYQLKTHLKFWKRLSGSIILAIWYILQGQFMRAKMIFKLGYNMFKGFYNF